MILGYIILDLGGNLVVYKELIHFAGDRYQALFSSIMKAINDIMGEVFKSRLRHVELEKYHVYLGFGDKFGVIIISDMEDDRLVDLASRIAKALNKYKDIDDVMLQIDTAKKMDIQKTIEKIIFGSPPSILSIRKLAESLLAVMGESKGELLGLKEVRPRKFKPGILEKIKRILVAPVSINDLLEEYYQGDLIEVVKKAPSLFSDENFGDLAKILYSKAALTLNSFDPIVEAPSLNEIRSVIVTIKDPFARKYLESELKAFYTVGSYNERRDLFLKHQFELFEKLSSTNDAISSTYAILINPLPYRQLLEYLERKFIDKSDYLYAMALEMRILLNILTQPPESPEEILSLMGRVKSLFEKAYKSRSKSMYSYFHVLQFTLVWGSMEKKLSVGDGVKLLEMFIDLFDSYKEYLIDKGYYSTNRHKAVNLYFAFNIVLRILLELKSNPAELVDKYMDYVYEKTKWFVGLGKTNRIMLDMYYISLAGLISILSRMALEKKKFYRDMINLIIELANPDMESFWQYNEYHFAHYYVDLLDAIGNIALFIDLEYVRSNILMKVAFGIERICRMFQDTPIIYYIEIVKAIRFYLLSKVPEGKNKARELLDYVKENASPFIVYLAKKIFQKYGGDQ